MWFPARRLYVSAYGTIRAGATMGRVDLHRLCPTVNTATPAQLATDPLTSPFPGGSLSSGGAGPVHQLPHPYPRVRPRWPEVIVRAGPRSPGLDKIGALENWIGATPGTPPISRHCARARTR